MLRNEASQKRFFTSLRFIQNDKSSPYFIQNDKKFVQNLIKLCSEFLFYNVILSCWGTKHLKKRFFTSLRFIQNDKSSSYFIQNDRRFLQKLIKLCNKFLFYNVILSCWGTKHLKKRFFTSLRFVQNDKSSPCFVQNDKNKKNYFIWYSSSLRYKVAIPISSNLAASALLPLV